MTITELYKRREDFYQERNPAKKAEILSGLVTELGIDPRTIEGFRDAYGKLAIAIRLRTFREKGLTVGSRVNYGEDPQVYIIARINDKTAAATLVGKSGAVAPSSLKLTE